MTISSWCEVEGCKEPRDNILRILRLDMIETSDSTYDPSGWYAFEPGISLCAEHFDEVCSVMEKVIGLFDKFYQTYKCSRCHRESKFQYQGKFVVEGQLWDRYACLSCGAELMEARREKIARRPTIAPEILSKQKESKGASA